MQTYNCIVVLGPTASGKTKLACQLAGHFNGEIISADSRQVYKLLDIGTGKDLKEYQFNGRAVAYHMIDIAEPAEQFFLHEYIKGLEHSFNGILERNHLPVICGGTGLYLDALTKDFSLTQVKENPELRQSLEGMDKKALIERLNAFPPGLTGHVDQSSKKRLIRGLEVAEYLLQHPIEKRINGVVYKPFYIGINIKIEERKKRIEQRLDQRLREGMIVEVETLLEKGLSHERLRQLGLEYKFISMYLEGKLSLAEMRQQLLTAIFQFAKRQMTWFRKMEKEGALIHWIEPGEDLQNLIGKINKEFRT